MEHQTRGRPQQSLRVLKGVRARLEPGLGTDPTLAPVLARALLTQATAEFDVSGVLAASLRLLEDAEALAERSGTGAIAASIRGQRGLLYLRSGLTEEALTALDAAAALIDQAEPADQKAILLNRSALHLQRGSLRLAGEDLELCLRVAEATQDRERYWAARHNLGYLDFLAGRLPRALAQIEEALAPELGEPHPVNLLDQARVLREAGLVRDADVILTHVATRFRRGRLQQDLAETELDLAECALVEGDARRARALAGSARRRFDRRGNQWWLRRAELLALRCDRRLIDERRTPGSRRQGFLVLVERAETLAAACRDEGRHDLLRAVELVGLDARLGAGHDVGPLPAVRPGDPLSLRLQSREVRARAALAGGDLGRASAEVGRGLADLGSYQNRFGSLDLRTASAVHGGALAKLQLAVALATGRPAEVFNGIERARAVSTRLPSVRPPSDDRTAELLAELRQVEEEARSLDGDPAAAPEVERLRDRAGTLQRSIRARAWELEGKEAVGLSSSARLARVREAAGESAFATYARHEGRWLAVVATGRRTALCELADVRIVDDLVRRVRADLDAIAMPHLPPPIAAAVRASVVSTLRRLDELLVEPLRARDRELTVSVSGSLAVLPWGLLPSRQGVPTVVTPSATSWLAAQGSPRPAAPTVVAVAGPDLRGAEQEAALVASVWTSGRVLTGAAATTQATHAALQSADVVHVASHGTHRQDNPLFSSLRLADGQLFAYELDAERQIAPFVGLSSCEAGLSTVRPGDEGLGLTNVLLHLGARAVLAGIARVNDQVAADVMVAVHHGMTRGESSALALARAQATWLDDGVPAPFVSFGSSW